MENHLNHGGKAHLGGHISINLEAFQFTHMHTCTHAHTVTGNSLRPPQTKSLFLMSQLCVLSNSCYMIKK